MEKRITKIPFGLLQGELTHVDEVESGRSCGCICVNCSRELVARKGKSRINHFAHYHDDVNCSPETVLHILGKRLLRERIEQCLSTDTPLYANWECAECRQIHHVNILSKARQVREEFSIGSFRPDLVLINSNRPYIGIEIIVSHAPEDQSIEGYKLEKMTRVEFLIETEKDLADIVSETLKPSFVDYCSAEKCKCGGIIHPRDVFIVKCACWKCKSEMKAVYGYLGYGPVGPEYLEPAELNSARSHGVKVERRYSKAARSAYISNICPSCNSIWGRNHLGDLWDFGDLPGNSHVVLKQCEKCKTISD